MEHRKPIGIKLSPAVLAAIDALRDEMPARPTRTACIEAAIIEWVEQQRRVGVAKALYLKKSVK